MYKKMIKALICLLMALVQAAECAPSRESSSHNTPEYSGSSSPIDDDEMSFFPFQKSQSKMPDDDVAGLFVKGKKIAFLGYDNTYFAEELPDGFSFSEMKFFSPYSKLISFKISNMALTKDVLENLQKFLPIDIKDVALIDCPTEKENIELINDIFKKHKQLTSITIEMLKSEKEDSTTALSAFAEHSNMTHVGVAFDEISAEACEKLAKLMENSSKTIEDISLAWNGVEQPDKSYQTLIESMEKAEKLKKLDLCIASISETDLKNLVTLIGKLKKLTDLRLFFGNLSEHDTIKLFESMEEFRDSLKELKVLENLNVSLNHLSGHGMQVLMQAISSMPKIRSLNISGNEMDEQSAEILSEGIKGNDSLETLIANECEINDKIFISLCQSWQNAMLKHLYFSGNKIEKEAKALPVSTMHDLVFVDFSLNDMDYDSVTLFAEATKNHPTLRIVNFRDNSGIKTMDSIEKGKRDDQQVEWQFVNDSHVSFFGL
jgi:hypothetical protein